MSGSPGTLTGAIFLALLRADRPLFPREIKAAAIDGKCIKAHPKSLHTILRGCTRQGNLVRITNANGRHAYAVTPACATPPGIRLADILEAVA